MRAIFLSAFCAVALLPAPAWASGANSAAAAPAPEVNLDEAVDAWRRGEWTRVRDLLEPTLRSGGSFESAEQTVTGLRHLADATLLDESLAPGGRSNLAREYIERLLDRDIEWSPPPDTHSAEFETLLSQVREQRRLLQANNCAIERTACRADLSETRVKHGDLLDDHRELQAEFDAELVETRSYTSQNRLVALAPFGVGHFYNGRPGFGAGFLATEAVFGITGLTLMLVRTLRYNCVREAGFSRGSVTCSPPRAVRDLGPEGARKRVEDVRNAEQTFGILFLGSMVVDVIISQVLFEELRLLDVKNVPRADLDAQGSERAAPEKARRRTKRRGAESSKITPSVGPGSVGLRLEF